MEQLLLKMARQLDSLDEASLLGLWEKYATAVSNFEPTQRWEEAALVFSLIQAKHWKNQLFNLNWVAQSRPGQGGRIQDLPLNIQTIGPVTISSPLSERMASFHFERTPEPPEEKPSIPPEGDKHAKIIAFRPRKQEIDPVIVDDDDTETPARSEDADLNPEQPQ